MMAHAHVHVPCACAQVSSQHSDSRSRQEEDANLPRDDTTALDTAHTRRLSPATVPRGAHGRGDDLRARAAPGPRPSLGPSSVVYFRQFAAAGAATSPSPSCSTVHAHGTPHHLAQAQAPPRPPWHTPLTHARACSRPPPPRPSSRAASWSHHAPSAPPLRDLLLAMPPSSPAAAPRGPLLVVGLLDAREAGAAEEVEAEEVQHLQGMVGRGERKGWKEGVSARDGRKG